MADGKVLRLAAERFDLPDDLVVICIPEWFRSALLDMTHRMLWSRVWTTSEGVERVLSEIDRKRIEYGIYKLSQQECDMEIINNVNVSCGGCGTSEPTTIYCVLQDGTPVITPQPPPPEEPPVPGGGTLPLDPATDPPPEGFDNWSEFDTYACTLANSIWWFAHFMVSALAGLIDLATAAAVVITLIVPLLPAGVIGAIGGVTLIDIAWQLVQIGALSQAGDIMAEIQDWLESERSEIICYLYSSRYSFALNHATNLGIWAADYLELTLFVSPEERSIIERFVSKLFDMTLFWGFVAYQIAEDFGLDTSFPAYDCSNCQADVDWTYNLSNGDGTWQITYEGTDGRSVAASGLSPTAGTTQIQAMVSQTGLDANVLGYAVVLEVNEISSSLGAEVTLEMTSETIVGITASGYYGERWLIHNSAYAGPTAGFDRVFNTGNGNGLGVRNSSDQDEPNTAFMNLKRTAASQAQSNCVIDVYGITVLDINGQVLWDGE